MEAAGHLPIVRRRVSLKSARETDTRVAAARIEDHLLIFPNDLCFRGITDSQTRQYLTRRAFRAFLDNILPELHHQVPPLNLFTG